MNYRKKLKEYRLRIKNQQTLKFVEFLETLYDWIDLLHERKRLKEEQIEKIPSYLPKKLMFELDKISPTELSSEEYGRLKGVLVDETSKLIKYIIYNGHLLMSDFDLFQFNLYQIFKKEETASMLEWARLSLEKVILKRHEKEIEKKEKKKREKEEYFKTIKSMPQKELIKLITKAMFDFTPSARTHDERLEAIKNNERKIRKQKIKFRNFERRLFDATEEAKKGAQNVVFSKIDIAKGRVENVSDQFRKKAKEFVSDEGPKKKIRKAKKMLSTRKGELQKELKEKGENWERNFGTKVVKAQRRISSKKIELSSEIKIKGENWKKEFGRETSEAQEELLQKKEKLSEKRRGRRIYIEKKGKSELKGARKMLEEERSEFKEDVEGAKEKFSGKEREMGKARKGFEEQRDVVQEAFIQRGGEIEIEMSDTIHKGRRKFETEREIARRKFIERADEMSGKALSHISKKRFAFSSKRDEARKRFLAKTEEISGNHPKKEGRSKLITQAGKARNKIEKQHFSMIEKSKKEREKMKKDILLKRGQFLYNVRFARHNIQEHAKEFGERVAEKREEFETKQEQIVSRHKAHQKAHLIQNLLRTIRTMK